MIADSIMSASVNGDAADDLVVAQGSTVTLLLGSRTGLLDRGDYLLGRRAAAALLLRRHQPPMVIAQLQHSYETALIGAQCGATRRRATIRR